MYSKDTTDNKSRMLEGRIFNIFRGERGPEEPVETQRVAFDGERYFDIRIFRKKRAEVVLKDKEDKVAVDFTKLLPPKYKLEIGKSWASDHMRNVVHIGPWSVSRDVVGLLHETGHAWNEKDQVGLFNAVYRYNASVMDYRTEDKEKADAEEGLKRAVLGNERNAWAWGLREARRVRRETGVDLLKDFKDVKELKEYIDYFLGGYEQAVDAVKKLEMPYAGPLTAKEIEEYTKV
mgnify:CR=1 FL=1